MLRATPGIIAAMVVVATNLTGLSAVTGVGFAQEMSPPGNGKDWKIVGRKGTSWVSVFVTKLKVNDRNFLAGVLWEAKKTVEPRSPLVVQVFDDLKSTPQEADFEETIEPRDYHFRAVYNENPNTGHVEFQWVKVVKKNGKPQLDLTVDSIRAKPYSTP